MYRRAFAEVASIDRSICGWLLHSFLSSDVTCSEVFLERLDLCHRPRSTSPLPDVYFYPLLRLSPVRAEALCLGPSACLHLQEALHTVELFQPSCFPGEPVSLLPFCSWQAAKLRFSMGKLYPQRQVDRPSFFQLTEVLMSKPRVNM